MTIARSMLIGSALIALAAPALAETPAPKETWPTSEETARAFKAICVDNAGDHKAQARAAAAKPWNMIKSKDSTDRRTYYDSFPWQVSLSNTESGLKLCSVTTGTDASTTDAQARTAAIAVLGPRPADLENEEGGFYWTPKIKGRDYMILYQAQTFENDGNPISVVSYGLSWK